MKLFTDFFHMILIWLHLCYTYDHHMKEFSYVNHMYIVSYDSHMSVHMILIWSVTYDTHMIRYAYDTYDSHMKGNTYENHMWRNCLCIITKISYLVFLSIILPFICPRSCSWLNTLSITQFLLWDCCLVEYKDFQFEFFVYSFRIYTILRMRNVCFEILFKSFFKLTIVIKCLKFIQFWLIRKFTENIYRITWRLFSFYFILKQTSFYFIRNNVGGSVQNSFQSFTFLKYRWRRRRWWWPWFWFSDYRWN